MVLSHKYWIDDIKKMKKKRWNYLVVNVKSLKENTKKLEIGIEVLEIINSTFLINKIYEKTNPDLVIDISILYEVIHSVYTEEPLTRAQNEQYHQLLKTLWETNILFYDLGETECMLSTDVNWMLLGLSFDEMDILTKQDISDLEDIYGDIWWKEYLDGGDVDKFLNEAKITVSRYKNFALINKKGEPVPETV